MKNAYAAVVPVALTFVLAGVLAGCGSPSGGADDALPPYAPSAPALALPSSPASAPASTRPVATAAPTSAAPAAQRGSGGGAPATVPADNPKPTKVPGGCNGTDLAASLRPGATSGDKHTATVGLRNRSGRTCVLSGFADMQLVGAGNDPISTLAVQVGQKSSVSIKPGATAWAPLSWSSKPAADERTTPCQPSAVRLAVFAPSDHTELDVAYAAGPVCQHGRMQIGAFA